MAIKTLIENTVMLTLTESWERNLTVMLDRPLCGACFNVQEMTGEEFLEELPELQTSLESVVSARN